MSNRRWPHWLLRPCGTPAAYRRHLRRGEPVDPQCREAARLQGAFRGGAYSGGKPASEMRPPSDVASGAIIVEPRRRRVHLLQDDLQLACGYDGFEHSSSVLGEVNCWRCLAWAGVVPEQVVA